MTDVFRRGIFNQLDATIAANSRVIARAIDVMDEQRATMQDQRIFMRELLLRSEKRMQQFDVRMNERHEEIMAGFAEIREAIREEGREHRQALLAILDQIRSEPGGGAAPA